MHLLQAESLKKKKDDTWEDFRNGGEKYITKDLKLKSYVKDLRSFVKNLETFKVWLHHDPRISS